MEKTGFFFFTDMMLIQFLDSLKKDFDNDAYFCILFLKKLAITIVGNVVYFDELFTFVFSVA